MTLNANAKFKIYQDIVCLEMDTPQNIGAKYWDQGYGLAYTPVHLREIKKVRYGIVRGMGESAGRRVLAAWYQGRWVAINLPRSDVPSLKLRNLFPQDLPEPYTQVFYTPLP